MILKTVIGTPECDYVLGLPWRWHTYTWTIKNVPKYTAEKLRTIFLEWGMGWDADERDCRMGLVNVNVDTRQWKRVGINMTPPDICTSNEKAKEISNEDL